MTKATVLFASPSAIGSSPEACGSSVPACPARFACIKRFTALTAWFELRLTVLSMTPLPFPSRLTQIGRHPHLGDRDQMTLDHRVMHGPARQHLRQRMAHELADPQLTLREHLARARIALMPSAGHDRPAWPSCPDWSAYPSACE